MFTPQSQGVFKRLRGEHYTRPASFWAKIKFFSLSGALGVG